MTTFTKYLDQNINGYLSPWVGVWVRIRNNVTSTDYVSTAITDVNGMFTVTNVPSGTYTVYTGPTSTNTPNATGNTNLAVEPVTPGGVFNVLDFGAKGDGVTDDRVALKAAATAALNGVLYFSPGNYLVTVDGTSHNCIDLPGPITVMGASRETVTITVKAGVGNYNAVMASPSGTAACDLRVSGITFNLNATNNATPNNAALVGLGRQAIISYVGSDATLTRWLIVENCRFTDADGTWLIANGGLTGTGKTTGLAVVRHCVFDKIGTTVGLAHDHSSVYLQADRVECHDNDFLSRGVGNMTATTAIEVHARVHQVHDNRIFQYVCGAQLVGDIPSNPMTGSFHDNEIQGVGLGASLVPALGAGTISLQDYTIHDNVISLDHGTFQGSFNQTTAQCFTANLQTGVMRNLNIHHNTVRAFNLIGAVAGDSVGTFIFFARTGTGYVDDGIFITDNILDTIPAGGILLNFSTGTLNRVIVRDNIFKNIGQLGTSAYGSINNAEMYINATVLSDVSITNNKLIDTNNPNVSGGVQVYLNGTTSMTGVEMRGNRVRYADGLVTGAVQLAGAATNSIFLEQIQDYFQVGSGNYDYGSRILHRNVGANVPYEVMQITRPYGTNWIAINHPQATVAYAASITPDVSLGAVIPVGTLTGNITINAPINITTPTPHDVRLTFLFTQDGTGGRTVTWNAIFKVNWIPSTAPNGLNTITFYYNGTNWIQLSYATGLI